MKKQLFLLAMLLISVGTWAQIITGVGTQITDFSTLTNGTGGGDHYVVQVIKNKASGGDNATDTYLYSEDVSSRIKAGSLNFDNATNYRFVFNIHRKNTNDFYIYVNDKGIPSFNNTATGGFDIAKGRTADKYTILPVEGQSGVFMLRGYGETKAHLMVEDNVVKVTNGATDAMWVKVFKANIKSSAFTFDPSKSYYLVETTTGLIVNNTANKVKLSYDPSVCEGFKIALDSETGCHTFQNAEDSKYLYAGRWDAEMSENKCIWSIEKVDGENFALHFMGGSNADCQIGFLGTTNIVDGQQLYSNQTLKDGKILKFKLVDLSTLKVLTYNFRDTEGNLIYSQTAKGIVGTPVPNAIAMLSVPSDMVTLTGAPTGNLESTTEFDITVSYNNNFPFQPTTIENNEFSTGTKWYNMKIRNNGKRIKADGDNVTEGNFNNQDDDNQYFAFTGNAVTGFYIHNRNLGATKSVLCDASAATSNVDASFATTGTPMELLHGSADGYWQFAPVNRKKDAGRMHDLDNNLGYWHADNAPNDPGSNFTIFEVDKDGGKVSRNFLFKENGILLATKTIEAYVGYDVTLDLPYGVVCSNITYVPSENTDIEVDWTYTPFKYAADYASIDQWYALDIHGNEGTYPVYSDGESVKVLYNANDNTKGNLYQYDAVPSNAYRWAFVGNPFDGFKIVNKALGNDKSIYQSEDGDVAVSMNASGQPFEVFKGAGSIDNSVSLKINERNYYLNHREDKIQGWTSADEGSSFRIYPADFVGTMLKTDQTMEVGKYYRIKNTVFKTYMGVNGYTYNMKNNVADETDPGQIWKLEEDNNNKYLKNVYTGLYPQNVPGGGANTTQIGGTKSNAFTYSKHGENDYIWNVYFGNIQVNIEPNGNVNYWDGDNAHHYIFEVEASDDDLATMCENWYSENPCTTEYNEIDIEDGAEVISPSEFVAPSDINAYIDNIRKMNEGEGVTQSNIHNLFNTILIELNKYKTAVNNHGALKSMLYTPTAEWGTIILPINWGIPNGWTCYSCSGADGNVLTLTQNGTTSKNKPYIINAGTTVGTTYQFIGYSTGALEANQTEGWLTGVLQDEAFNCPVNSYVLAKYNDVIGFYQVETGAKIQVPKYKCYLTAPAATEARFGSFFFDATETGIESMDEVEGSSNAVIYDLAGRRVQNAKKGLYIVNGKKIIR